MENDIIGYIVISLEQLSRTSYLGDVVKSVYFEYDCDNIDITKDFVYNEIEREYDHGSVGRVVSDKCDPDNISDTSKAELIKVDMTFEEVVEILGKPIAEFGSGAIWHEWSLDNDTKLQIQFRRKGMEDQNLYVLRIIIKE